MTLIEQIRSIALTFLFGILFSLFFNILYKILFTKKIVINIFINLVFFILFSSLYFYFLYNINGGIIHFYLFLVFIISFLLYNRLFKKIRWIG